MVKKPKGLFDHLTAIYVDKRVEYWDELTDGERKSCSPFMVNRFLSMNMDYLELVNLFQVYYDAITPRETYMFYSDALPRGKRWAKYIKGKKEKSYDPWVLETLASHYHISQAEAVSYIELFLRTDEGKESLKSILQKYGGDPKTIKKVVK